MTMVSRLRDPASARVALAVPAQLLAAYGSAAETHRQAEAALDQEELRHRRCSDECEPHRLLQQLVNVAERHRLQAADALASRLLENERARCGAHQRGCRYGSASREAARAYLRLVPAMRPVVPDHPAPHVPPLRDGVVPRSPQPATVHP